MAEQRRRAKDARKTGLVDDDRVETYREIVEQFGHTAFTGYDERPATATSSPCVAGDGDEVEIFTDRTPFYAEAGGQVGDTGRITTDYRHAPRCSTPPTPCPGSAATVAVRRGRRDQRRPGRAPRRRPGAAARPSGATTPAPTCCTGRCARCSAST